MLFLAKLDATEKILRTLCAWLCKMIYPLISWAYTLFMEISSFELLTSEEIRPIYERVTMVLAIVMVFYVTFEFVKYVIQPDEMTSKEKGVNNLAYKLIAVVLLIAFVPQIFNLAYTVQSKVIESELLSKVILGKSGVDSTTFGREFSANMLNVFYYHDTEEWGEGETCNGIPCSEIVAANLETLRTEGKLPYLNTGLNEAGTAEMTKSDETTENVEVALIHFDALFAVVVGGFIAYMLILYCVDVGVRAVQLLYLQIIAPIPIIGFISPKKDGIFQKWCKQCVTTYLDLFIRMSIIYFILLVCQTLLDSNVFENLGEARFFVKIALIMGLLLFARKAPKMLQELFPSTGAASGNFGLKAGERVAPEVARVLGASAGGVNRLVKGGIARAANTRKRNQEIREKRRAAGKDTSIKAVRQERRQADKDERHARKQRRYAQQALNRENRQTRAERNAVLDAERELAEAKRSGNQSRIDAATKKLADAKLTQDRKKAELSARRELDAARKSGNASKIAEAEKKLQDIQNLDSREQRNRRTEEIVENKNAEVSRLENKRKGKNERVEAAQAALEQAQQSGDANAIAAAQSALEDAKKTRDGVDVYNQQQIIDSKQAEIDRNNQAVAAAQNQYSAASAAVANAQAKVNDAETQGNASINAAQAALTSAQQNGGSAEEIAIAKKAVEEAKVAKNIAVSKAQSELTAAQSTESSARTSLTAAISNRDNNNQRLEREKTAATSARDAAVAQRDAQYEKAKKAQEQAQQRLEKTKELLETSKSTVTDMSTATSDKFDEAKATYAKTQSDRAEIENQRYRSVVGNAVAGSAGGAWRGITIGGQATKLEDVGKKVKEAEKKDTEVIAAREKWLDSGGTTLGSKIKSTVQKDFGVLTDAQVSEIQTRNYDAQIKSNKRISAVEGATKTNLDSSKDRSGSKIEAGEQKTKIKQGTKLKYKDPSGAVHIFEEDYTGKTTSEAYQAERNKAVSARERAAALQQAAVNARAEGKPNAAELERQAEQAAQEATAKEIALGQKKKALLEYAITDILQTPESMRRNKDIQPDQVLVDFVANTLQSVEESKRNKDTYDKMIAKLTDPKVRHAYITGKFEDYDQLDTVQAALNEIKGQRDRDTTKLETMAGVYNASSKLDAEKAADGATGGK